MGINHDELDKLRKDSWSYRGPIEGEYELIDTITISDGVTKLDVSVEPDGTPYRFERVFLKLTIKENTPAAEGWSFWDQAGVEIMYHYHGTVSSANVQSGMQVWKEAGYWTGEVYAWRGLYSTYGTTYHAGRDEALKVSTAGSYISRIKADELSNGITVEVWGVRPHA